MNAPPPFLAKWILEGKIELGIARQKRLREARAERAMRGHKTERDRRFARAAAMFGKPA